MRDIPYCERAKTRASRGIDGLGDRWQWERLYHPTEQRAVQNFVDGCLRIIVRRGDLHLQQDEYQFTQELVNGCLCIRSRLASAKVGAREEGKEFSNWENTNDLILQSATYGSVDVTLKVAAMVSENGGVLRLVPPTPLVGSKRQAQSVGTWVSWYSGYFGDPQPCRYRTLKVVLYCPTTHQLVKKFYPEKPYVCLQMRDPFMV